MKNITHHIFIIIFILFCNSLSAQDRIKTYEGYQLVWNDEFETDGKPDSTKWGYEYGFERNKELQWYQPLNAYCRDSKLIIEGKREKIKNPNYVANSNDWKKNREYAEYSSACVVTKGLHSWTYGRFEIKAKIPAVKGSWPAIWFLGWGKVKSWPYCGEIDLMEYYRIKDEPTILANTVFGEHIWDSSYTPMSHFFEKDADWENKYHIWRMDWTEEYIRLYLDGELLNETDVSKTVNPDGYNPFQNPQYMLINLAIGERGGDPSNTQFPLFYEIDYVRVYQKK
ncbi:MAG: glycoside hydrolase family 16 protein [Prevotella sp.]|jgi:beta-glucanase (GH16 family)|nr:glycoside hydrolase family 16 protein [Prevotella sp.]